MYAVVLYYGAVLSNEPLLLLFRRSKRDVVHNSFVYVFLLCGDVYARRVKLLSCVTVA